MNALKNANTSLQDALTEKTKHDIQTQIDAFGEERDKLLKEYDEQIAKLDQIKDKWSEIADNIKYAQDIAKANEILGTGWQEKILSGNDDALYQQFKNNYENVEAQKELYEKQIETNEKLSTLMEDYLDAYQQGTLSLHEVISKFDELIASAKDGLSTNDYLDAILNLNGDRDASSALSGIQDELSGSYDMFREYLGIAEGNNKLFAQYTSTWEEIRKAVTEQLELLKKQATEEARRVSSSGEPFSINKKLKKIITSKGPNWNTPDGPATGPGKEIEVREKQKQYKDGLKMGAVQSSPSQNVETIQALGLRKLKPDEVLATLHVGEVVVNPEQMERMVGNYQSALMAPVVFKCPELTSGTSSGQNKVEINFGDITLPNVKNGEEFAESLKRNFDPMMTQYFSKLF